MKKLININQVLTTFDGKPIKTGEVDFTLRDALLTYLRNAGSMRLSDPEQSTAYITGILVAQAPTDTALELTTAQYDVIKKMADFGKVVDGSGKESEMWGTIEVKYQIKNMVDSAENVVEDVTSETTN